MSALLDLPPYAQRDDARLFDELFALSKFHAGACEPYLRIAAGFPEANSLEELPFVHVGLFKEMELRSGGAKHSRVLLSSATTSGISSRIALDEESSKRQAKSVTAILSDFVGAEKRALLVLDDAKGLRGRGEVSARIAAALGLKELSSDLYFVLSEANGVADIKWDVVARALDAPGDLLLYGFTWVFWTVWLNATMPEEVRARLKDRRVSFIHSGGWKKLDALKVSHDTFNATLLASCAPDSIVLDYYGLVEQVGVIYPLCEKGARHAPAWADVIVRNPITLEPSSHAVGQLQLLNTLPVGGPYHSVLTEDLGMLLPDNCDCGRRGRRFQLIGRIPKAEIRGCANV